jgi:membrane-associated protease RseP (regulator of RpoE activity)
MVSLEIVSTIAFFVIIGILLVLDRKNLEIQYGVIVRRWKKGREIIDKIVRKHKKLLSSVGLLGVIIGFIVSAIGVYFLVACAFFPSLVPVSSLQDRCFGIVLPTVGGFQYPGPVFSVPFWYWIIGVFVIIGTHETMHAVFARLYNVPIKSYGILLFLVLPIGAFVDPDTKKVAKLQILQKLRIFAAGSFSNIVVGLLFFLFILAVTAYLFEPSGVAIGSLINNTPAYNANLTGIITYMNGAKVGSVEDLSNVLKNIKVGEKVNITTTERSYMIETVERPDNQSGGFIGITKLATVIDVKSSLSNYSAIIRNARGLLFWIFLLSIGVGIANMLPLKPFDGGLMYEELFHKIFKHNAKLIMNVISFIIVFLIIINLFGIGLIRALT